MSRSPLAYPLTRGVDGDAGGSADLQTDIMRFMAILALCLVAIFALVQSIPLVPEKPAPEPVVAMPERIDADPPPVVNDAQQPEQVPELARPEPVKPAPGESVALTRPKWRPKPRPERTIEAVQPVAKPAPADTVLEEAPPPPAPAEKGFTLRFESDLALTRLVAASQVGFYALTPSRSQRMTVSNSRISFWDASLPNAYHEMEASTVPEPVITALARSGVDTANVEWGVTLPGRLSRRLEGLMLEHTGGSLVIGLDGQVRLENQP